MCYDHLKYGRIPREPQKVRYYRLAVALLFIVLILMAYDYDAKHQLVDQPTAKEKAAKLRQEKDEAAALSLFNIPSKREAKP